MSGARWTSLGRRRLVAVLARSGVTLKVLARSAGVTVAALSALACGVNREPSLRVALALKKSGIDPADWLIDSRLEERRTLSIPIEAGRVTTGKNNAAAE